MSLQIGIVSNTIDLGVMVTRNLLIKLLRQTYPDARLLLITEQTIADKARQFHQHASWIDGYLTIEAQCPKSTIEKLKLCRQVRSWNLDMIILSPWSKLPGWIPYLCRIPTRVGLTKDERQRKYLTHPVTLDVPADDPDLHWSHILTGYVKALHLHDFKNISEQVPFIRLNRKTNVTSSAAGRIKVAVHVGGNAEWNRRWPLANFIRLCQQLVRETDAVIFLIGSADEIYENRAVVEAIKNESRAAQVFDISAAGVQTTAQCIAQADLFIGNDSGPMNIAVAVGTPIVAIRGADPENFRPDLIDPRHAVISAWQDCGRFAKGSQECDRGCPVSYDREKQDYPKCMASIPFEKVWSVVTHQFSASGVLQ